VDISCESNFIGVNWQTWLAGRRDHSFHAQPLEWPQLSSERKMLDNVKPVGRFGRLCDQFQIGDVRPERRPTLVPEQQPGKWASLPLPVLGHCFESKVLREQNSTQNSSAFQ
jgi:hypothetical protein